MKFKVLCFHQYLRFAITVGPFSGFQEQFMRPYLCNPVGLLSIGLLCFNKIIGAHLLSAEVLPSIYSYRNGLLT